MRVREEGTSIKNQGDLLFPLLSHVASRSRQQSAWNTIANEGENSQIPVNHGFAVQL